MNGKYAANCIEAPIGCYKIVKLKEYLKNKWHKLHF